MQINSVGLRNEPDMIHVLFDFPSTTSLVCGLDTALARRVFYFLQH
jgi:hypothetical protein